MIRAQRRALYKKMYRREWHAHFLRLPGSPHPFSRLKALLEHANSTTLKARVAYERFIAMLSPAWWKALFFARKTERLAYEAAQANRTAQRLLKAAREALYAYKSRGKGRGRLQPRVYIAARSKYMAHQGERECARRRGMTCA